MADEIAEKWSKLPNNSKVPLMEYMSIYTLKTYLHTLYGNLMKDDKDELHFRSEIDEVRNSGPGCSKLTMSLGNVSLKFQTLLSQRS